MKAHGLRLMALCTIPFAGACADEQVGSEARGLELAIAPLQLPGIGQACFDLEVTNAAGGAGDTVWSKGTPGHQTGDLLVGDPDAVCSGQYGNGAGGDVTYIGPCDADGPDNDADGLGERMNSVTVWFDGLYYADDTYIDPDGEDGWQDPCGTAGCTLDVLCEENTDALVEFNFTVLRDAQQGFFDIIVNFKDVFCSGKYDTCYDEDEDGTPETDMELLFGDGDVDGDGRDYTGVLALACSGGVDGEPQPDGSPAEAGGPDTLINYSQVFIRCSGPSSESFVINANAGPGQHTAVSTPNSRKLQYAIYQDTEELDCGTATEHVYDADGNAWLYGENGEYYAKYDEGVWTLFDEQGTPVAGVDNAGPTPPAEFFISAILSVYPYEEEVALSCNKIFLNFAFNLEDLTGYNCSLQAQATAQSDDDIVLGADGLLAAANSSHPFINVAIKDMAACQQNPLNGDKSQMGTFYASNFVNGGWALPMCFEFDGTEVTPIGALASYVHDTVETADPRLSKDQLGRIERLYGFYKNCDGPNSTTRKTVEYQSYTLTKELRGSVDLVTAIPEAQTDANLDTALANTFVRVIQYSEKAQQSLMLYDALGVRNAVGKKLNVALAPIGDRIIVGLVADEGATDAITKIGPDGYNIKVGLNLVGEP